MRVVSVAIRSVIGQPKGLDLKQLLEGNKIFLVPLPKGVIGQETTALLGSLLVSSLWQATLERAAIPPEQRRAVFLTLDEVQEFLRLPGDIGDVLTQARGLAVSMTLAHQHLGQLPKELKAAVMANTRSKLFFQLTHQDAKEVAPLLSDWLGVEDLENLPVREAVLVPTVNSQVLPPCTILTHPLPAPGAESVAEYIRSRSAQTWGTKVEDLVIDRPLPTPDRTIRRTRRTSGKSANTGAGSDGTSGSGRRAPLSGGSK